MGVVPKNTSQKIAITLNTLLTLTLLSHHHASHSLPTEAKVNDYLEQCNGEPTPRWQDRTNWKCFEIWRRKNKRTSSNHYIFDWMSKLSSFWLITFLIGVSQRSVVFRSSTVSQKGINKWNFDSYLSNLKRF